MEATQELFSENVPSGVNLRSRAWFGTTYDLQETISVLRRKCLNADYLAIGFEVCPTTQRPHAHVYVRFSTQVVFSSMQKRGNNQVHWWRSIGTPKQASDYVLKGRDPRNIVIGELPQQGERTDLKAKLQSYASSEQFVLQEPEVYSKYAKGIDLFYKAVNSSSWQPYKPVVFWLYGVSGSGKTHFATHDNLQGTPYYRGDIESSKRIVVNC